MNWKFIFIISAFYLAISACSNDELETPVTENCDTTDMTYTDDIKAILDTSCAVSTCHNDNDTADGFTLENYNSAKAAASFANFLPAIMHESGFVAMPLGRAKLDQCDINKIAAWVSDGRPE